MEQNDNDIVYFTLNKALPSVEIGSMICIGYSSEKPFLFSGEIQLPFNLAFEYPDWFQPVTRKEYQILCKKNTKKWCKEKGISYRDLMKNM